MNARSDCFGHYYFARYRTFSSMLPVWVPVFKNTVNQIVRKGVFRTFQGGKKVRLAGNEQFFEIIPLGILTCAKFGTNIKTTANWEGEYAIN